MDKEILESIKRSLRKGDKTEISKRMQERGKKGGSIRSVKYVFSGERENQDVIDIAVEIIEERNAKDKEIKERMEKTSEPQTK